jgi:hypothetical protein
VRWHPFLVAALLLSSCAFVEDEEAAGFQVASSVTGPVTTSVDGLGDGREPPSATSRAVGDSTGLPPSRLDTTNGNEALGSEQRAPEEPGVTEWSASVDEPAATGPGSVPTPEVADLRWALGPLPPVKRSEGVFTLAADPGVPTDSVCFAAWRFLRHGLHLSATPSSTIDPDVYTARLDSARRSLEQLIDLTSGRMAQVARDVADMLERMGSLLAASYGLDTVRSFGDSLIGGPGQMLDGLIGTVAYSCPTVASGRPQVPFFWAEYPQVPFFWAE